MTSADTADKFETTAVDADRPHPNCCGEKLPLDAALGFTTQDFTVLFKPRYIFSLVPPILSRCCCRPRRCGQNRYAPTGIFPFSAVFPPYHYPYHESGPR